MSKQQLTQKNIRSLFDYDYDTGILRWKIAISKKIKAGDEAGWLTPRGYREVRIHGRNYKAHRIIWCYVYGYFPEYGIDHKNRIKDHNWLYNLREATPQCNARNTGNFKHNTSGIKGVCWDKRRNKWRSEIYLNKKSYSLGSYRLFDNAVCARLAGEQCLNWPGCDESSPAHRYVQKNIVRPQAAK